MHAAGAEGCISCCRQSWDTFVTPCYVMGKGERTLGVQCLGTWEGGGACINKSGGLIYSKVGAGSLTPVENSG
jgi:hypothetical protein